MLQHIIYIYWLWIYKVPRIWQRSIHLWYFYNVPCQLKKIKARQSMNTTKFSNNLKASTCTNTMLDNVDNFSHTSQMWRNRIPTQTSQMLVLICFGFFTENLIINLQWASVLNHQVCAGSYLIIYIYQITMTDCRKTDEVLNSTKEMTAIRKFVFHKNKLYRNVVIAL